MPQLTFWYEFASTYSYLSAARIVPLAKAAGVTVTWQPFLLGPIFAQQGWHTSPFNIQQAKGAYMWRDMARQIAKYDLPPLTQPEDFPQNGLLAARIALVGRAAGWCAAFSRAVFHAQFAQGRSIADEDMLRDILTQLDLETQTILTQAETDQMIKDQLRTATERAQELGLFGAPSFVTAQGELFWGNDRLEDALVAA